MAGTYTTVTLNDAWADLGSRLYDPDHVRWPTAELTVYVQQALRTYNAFTNHFRDTASFTTTVNESLYDLPTVAPALRALTYTVADAVTELCYHLLEPLPTGNLWRGTQQFALADLLQALQEARDTFLLETGVVQTRSHLTVDPAPSDGVVDLPEAVINLRRLVWQTDDGIQTILRRADQWALTNFRPGWQTASSRPPTGYSISAQPPLQVQLAPITTTTGTLDLLTVNRGADVTVVPSSVLGVPDDWAWVVVFGALGQLLQRDGLAIDPLRADYCDQRWQQGLDAAKRAAVVLAAEVGGVSTTLGAVASADAYSAAWPMVAGIPRRILLAGQTIVGTWPPAGVKPGGGNFTIGLQLVRNAPVPTLPGDVLQIGPELTNDILDYAQHLATFKEGPGQLQASLALYQQFMGLCGVTLKQQKASQPDEPAAVGQTVEDARQVAYEVPLP